MELLKLRRFFCGSVYIYKKMQMVSVLTSSQLLGLLQKSMIRFLHILTPEQYLVLMTLRDKNCQKQYGKSGEN